MPQSGLLGGDQQIWSSEVEASSLRCQGTWPPSRIWLQSRSKNPTPSVGHVTSASLQAALTSSKDLRSGRKPHSPRPKRLKKRVRRARRPRDATNNDHVIRHFCSRVETFPHLRVHPLPCGQPVFLSDVPLPRWVTEPHGSVIPDFFSEPVVKSHLNKKSVSVTLRSQLAEAAVRSHEPCCGRWRTTRRRT